MIASIFFTTRGPAHCALHKHWRASRRVASGYSRNRNIVAVMFEIIQGEGGIHLVDRAFYQGVREICDARNWLMICDEVQCGMGRTGKWFGYQQAAVLPDIATLAKGLGSGVPIGACMTRGRAAGLFGPGNHGSTFGGNPLACTAALTTIQVMEEDALLDNAARIGALIRQLFADALAETKGVKDIRGHGLMIGIELDRPCGELVTQALAAGVLINVTSDSVVRLLPPLIFSEADAQELVERVAPLIKAFLAG